jgi:hypothetical protein
VVEVSDWYSRRLTIHRYAAYSIIPVFGVQYVAGRQLWDNERDAPTWAKTTHRVGATALAGLFTVNTVTGLWNLWDSRSVTQGRALRYVHALTMLTARRRLHPTPAPNSRTKQRPTPTRGHCTGPSH